MDSTSALTGLARLSGLLVLQPDPLTVVTSGLEEARTAVSADAGGVLVTAASGALEVLAASSHRAADLEAYQAGSEQGPCVESMKVGRAISVASPEDAEARWPGFGERMEEAGYVRAHAVPMCWHGEGIGGLNLFWREGGELDESETVMLQTLADILTLAVVHVSPVSTSDALHRLRGALTSRSAIEQAKGALAFQRDIDMEGAYDALVRLARERRTPLAETAEAVVDAARRGEHL
jgi:ANTAR domain/GAF domain